MTDYFIWTTVEKDGKKFSVQLRLDNRLVEHVIASAIDADPITHTRDIVDGNVSIKLTRAS
jgi:hypothetical protein